MEKLMKQMGKGKMGMPDLASLQNGEAAQPARPRPSATKKRNSKRKKKKARR
jgi:hypothetical protein